MSDDGVIKTSLIPQSVIKFETVAIWKRYFSAIRFWISRPERKHPLGVLKTIGAGTQLDRTNKPSWLRLLVLAVHILSCAAIIIERWIFYAPARRSTPLLPSSYPSWGKKNIKEKHYHHVRRRGSWLGDRRVLGKKLCCCWKRTLRTSAFYYFRFPLC